MGESDDEDENSKMDLCQQTKGNNEESKSLGHGYRPKTPQSNETFFDDQEELERIQQEKFQGKTELVGCIFLNKANKIIGSCQDQFDELLYLVAYESTEKEVFTPTWCQSWLIM